jgi:hypothetical protein
VFILKEFSEVIAVTICLLSFNHSGILTADISSAMLVTAFACLIFRLVLKD